MTSPAGIDPIRLELIKNALDAIVDEMAIALMRSAYSTNIKTAMDMSTALCDAEGRLIAQGLTLPLHLGSIPDAMREVRRKFDGSIEPGDAFLLNDPYQGGTHLPDFYVFKPIFVGERRVGWSVSIGHQTDVGGKTAGGNGSDATEIFQEGLRIPPVKLYEAGQPVDSLFEVLAKNVRVPHLVLGDVRAQVAACLAGERGYLALIERYGVDELAAASTALLDQAERLARNAITAMPDGTFTFTDYIDEDGLDPDPIPIVVTITVSGDRMLVDFEGSARQVRGAINSPFPFTKSTVYACVRHLIGGDPPNNEGYFRPIEVRAPAGTVVNPVMPASVAARGLTGFRMANAVFGALAKVAPERVFACEAGGDTGISYGGYDADQAIRVHRVPVRRLGRAAGSRWRGRLQQLGGQLLEQPDRDHRGRAAAGHRPVRLRARHRRCGHVPGRAGARPRLPVRGRRGDLPAAHRPAPVHAVRAGRRARRDAVDEHPRSRRRSRGVADQVPPDRPQGRRFAPPGGRCGRLGRPAAP
jgi:N-methylhydantoinase B